MNVFDKLIQRNRSMNDIDLDVTHLDKDKLGVTLEDLVDNLRKEFIKIKVDLIYHL